MTLNNNNNNDIKQYVSIKYCGDTLDRIRRILKKNNLQVSYKSTNFLQKKLKNMEHEIDSMSLSGIYKLECQCGAQYMGKTTKKFKQRLHEHRYSFTYNNQKNLTTLPIF